MAVERLRGFPVARARRRARVEWKRVFVVYGLAALLAADLAVFLSDDASRAKLDANSFPSPIAVTNAPPPCIAPDLIKVAGAPKTAVAQAQQPERERSGGIASSRDETSERRHSRWRSRRSVRTHGSSKRTYQTREKPAQMAATQPAATPAPQPEPAPAAAPPPSPAPPPADAAMVPDPPLTVPSAAE